MTTTITKNPQQILADAGDALRTFDTDFHSSNPTHGNPARWTWQDGATLAVIRSLTSNGVPAYMQGALVRERLRRFAISAQNGGARS